MCLTRNVNRVDSQIEHLTCTACCQDVLPAVAQPVGNLTLSDGIALPLLCGRRRVRWANLVASVVAPLPTPKSPRGGPPRRQYCRLGPERDLAAEWIARLQH